MAEIRQPNWNSILPPEEQDKIRRNFTEYQQRNPGGSIEGVIQVDQRGRPYQMRNGAKVWMSPAHFDQSVVPQGGGGLFRGGVQWDQDRGQYHNPLSFHKLATLGTGAVLGAGALNAFGGAGGATTGSGASTAGTTGSGVGIGETAATTGLGGAAAKSGILGKVANMATGGMSFKDLAKLSLLQFGLGTAGDLMGGSDQERRPFAGAQQSLDSARAGLQGLMPQLQSRLGTPTRLKAPRMPNMSFSGGPLPFKVGLSGSSPIEGYGQGDPIQEAQSILDILRGRR